VDATADVLYGSAEEIFAKIEQYRREHKYRVLELFREIDKNRDGDLKIQEVMTFVKRVVPDVTDVQAARFRIALDANGDGKVTYNEVRACCHTPHSNPIEAGLRLARLAVVKQVAVFNTKIHACALNERIAARTAAGVENRRNDSLWLHKNASSAPWSSTPPVPHRSISAWQR